MSFKRYLTTTVVAAGLVLVPGPRSAEAGGIPTIDVAQINQLLLEFQQQLKDYEVQLQQVVQLKETYQKEIEQLQELQKQVTAITGSRAISSLMNGDFEKAARQAMAHNVNMAFEKVGLGDFDILTVDGNLAPGLDPERIAESVLSRSGLIMEKIEEMMQSEDAAERGSGVMASTGVVLSIAAQDSAVRSDEAIDIVTTLVDVIDDQVDIKGSMDLNTRMTAELAFRLIEMIRLEATQTAAMGQDMIVRARDRERQSKYTIYDNGFGETERPEGSIE